MDRAGGYLWINILSTGKSSNSSSSSNAAAGFTSLVGSVDLSVLEALEAGADDILKWVFGLCRAGGLVFFLVWRLWRVCDGGIVFAEDFGVDMTGPLIAGLSFKVLRASARQARGGGCGVNSGATEW